MEFYEVNGIKTIEFEADAFIIPNHAGSANDYLLFGEERKKFLDKISQENNCGELDFDNDPCCQLWFCSDDLDTENLDAHGAFIEVNGEELWIRPEVSVLPAKLFHDKKEGDTVVINIPWHPSFIYRRSKENAEPLSLVMNVKLNQKSYRYRNFGNFEEVLQYVTR